MTGPFVHQDLLGLLFSLLSYIPSAVMEENNMGTVPFAIRFFKLSLFINVVFCSLAVFPYLIFGFKGLLMEPAMGLWPILMCDLVIQCYQYPEMPRGLCCLPVQIKSKYYPLVLMGLFTIFFGLQFSLLTGLAVGYLWVFGLVKFLETSPQALRQWEQRWPFKGIKENPAFRQSASALANDPSANRGESGSGGFMNSFMGGGNSS